MSKLMPFLALAATVGLASGSVTADDDGSYSRHGPDVAPVENALYQDECGSCHFAYQPGLLPMESWLKLMGSLEDHFSENAALDGATRQQLIGYLVANAAENSGTRRSAKILRSLGKEIPIRITDVPYIWRQHDEIPPRLIRTNAALRSLSNCAACHTRAETGSYAERDILIPGMGRWED